MKHFISISLIWALSVTVIANITNEPSNGQEKNHSHPYGQPVNLMKFDENENIIINNEALQNIFLHPDVKDRKIVAVSIIGAFRKGKSFLMDYALRYMYANYKSIAYPDNPLSNKHDWIGDVNAPLKGFSWRGGTNRDTTGVIIWSDVFLAEHMNSKTNANEKLAIILLDTQGLFDSKTSPTDNSRIFALGTLISSIQIFNLNDVIQENQLEYLQMATDFAQFSMKKSRKGGKPFQTLVFLMRDWANAEEYDYGLEGGGTYLQETLNINPSQPKELREVRKYISDSFEQRLCFLLPHPGNAVSNKEFDGRFSELDADFQEQLKDFLNWLLQLKNLKKKKILGSEVVGTQYLEYLKLYFEAFQSNELPKVDTLHGITVKKQYDIVISESIAEYKSSLKPIEYKVNDEWKKIEDLEREINRFHNDGQRRALKIFKDKKKLGGGSDEARFEAQLKSDIAQIYEEWKGKLITSYTQLKEFDDQNKRQLEELNRQKEEELRREKERAEEQKRLLDEELQRKTREFEESISHQKNLTAQQVADITAEFEKNKAEVEKQRQVMWEQMEAEKQKIEEQSKKAQEAYKEQMEKMKEEIRQKEEIMKKAIEDQKAERLEIMKMEAEERKRQLDHQTEMAGRREKALAEQREFERQQRAEERKIREEADRKEREARREAEQQRIQADREFQQQIIKMRLEAEERERKEKKENERRHQEMIAQMNRNRNSQPTKSSPSFLQSVGCTFSFGLAC